MTLDAWTARFDAQWRDRWGEPHLHYALLFVHQYSPVKMRTGLVWETMKRNPHIRRGLKRAGFTGDWLG